MSSSYEILGDRASRPSDLQDAHGVAIIVNSAGLETSFQPFRHPTLLDNEVRVKVTHSGLCQSDIIMMKNGWGFTQFPFVGGHEILGVVTHVGEKVTNLQVGDRVGHGPQRDCCESCHDCLTGFNNLCSKSVLTVGLHYGGFATSFQSKANSFVKVPDQVPGSAAPLFCAGVTSFAPLNRDLVPGMHVGIVGIGGLGHLGIKIANKMGCVVTAISTSPDKEQEARELGAHNFINSKDPESLKKNLRTLDYILDTATSHNFATDFSLLKPFGVVNVVGAPDTFTHQPFFAGSIIMNQLTIKASAAGSRIDMHDMIDFCCFHSIYPKSEIYSLNDAQAAIDALGKGIPRAPRYRAVIDTASYFEKFTPSSN